MPEDTEDAASDRVEFWRHAAKQAIGLIYQGTKAMTQVDISALCKVNVAIVNKLLGELGVRKSDKKGKAIREETEKDIIKEVEPIV